MDCKICKAQAALFNQNTILSKYNISYFQCSNCLFIQTESPYWLDEAYSNAAISALDVGAVQRNLYLSNVIARIIKKAFLEYDKTDFLDYGGATGLFTRLMRDKGLSFFHTDKYAQNIYAKGFELEDLNTDTNFKAVTVFEVFEHLEEPMDEIKKLLTYSDTIIFSTELQPLDVNALKEWWYFIPETGQHIALYHIKTLENIASILNLKLYSNQKNLHILTKNTMPNNIEKYFKYPWHYRVYQKFFGNSKSLIIEDFQTTKKRL